MGKFQKNLVKSNLNVFPRSTLAGLYFDTLTKNTTFMTKVIGFWFLSPWFLIPISRVDLIPINVIMTSFNVFQMPILMLLNITL